MISHFLLICLISIIALNSSLIIASFIGLPQEINSLASEFLSDQDLNSLSQTSSFMKQDMEMHKLYRYLKYNYIYLFGTDNWNSRFGKLMPAIKSTNYAMIEDMKKVFYFGRNRIQRSITFTYEQDQLTYQVKNETIYNNYNFDNPYLINITTYETFPRDILSLHRTLMLSNVEANEWLILWNEEFTDDALDHIRDEMNNIWDISKELHYLTKYHKYHKILDFDTISKSVIASLAVFQALMDSHRTPFTLLTIKDYKNLNMKYKTDLACQYYFWWRTDFEDPYRIGSNLQLIATLRFLSLNYNFDDFKRSMLKQCNINYQSLSALEQAKVENYVSDLQEEIFPLIR